MKINNRVYFSFYLKENIIIFDVFEYIQQLGADTVDYLYNWSLFKDDKIIFKSKIIKEFLELKIKNDIQIVINYSKKINCNILCYFNENGDVCDWSTYFADYNRFICLCKKICKKQLPNFIEKKVNCLKFKHKKGNFFEIPCLIPSGEEEEILHLLIKKLK